MENKSIDTSIERLWPLTIIPCRYGGCYSGAKYHAFNCDSKDVPADATGSDIECGFFWDSVSDNGRVEGFINSWGENLFVGSGETPNDALKNLHQKLSKVPNEELSAQEGGNINWKELRDKFFKECTDKSEYYPEFGDLPKVNLAPHDLFEWFKKQIEQH